MLIVSVLKSSKNFTPKHAKWLHDQLKEYNSICLTDAGKINGVDTAKLLYNYPGWWSKLELFNPHHPVIGQKDLLYIDIDSVITGDLSDILKTKKFTMLTDFSCKNQINPPAASGVMFIPHDIKSKVWNEFNKNPLEIINKKRTPPKHGDQGFIGEVLPDCDRWQDTLPSQIISYKANIAKKGMIGFNSDLYDGVASGTVPKDARIVCFHGSPRPWHIAENWVPFFSVSSVIQANIKKLKLRLKNK